MRSQAVPDEKTVERLILSLNVKKPVHPRKKMIGAVIAAAAAIMLSISAAAVINYYHRESVERYINNDISDEDVQFRAVSAENDRFRITLDRTYCDGENVDMIFTVEPIDGEPFYEKTNAPKYSVTPELSPDGSFELNAGLYGSGSYSHYTDEDRENNIFRFVFHYCGRRIGRGVLGETHLRFAEFMYIAEPDNPFKDIFLQTDVEKNTDSVKLYAEDGTEAVMSQVGFYIYDYSVEKFYAERNGEELPEVFLIKTDGSEEQVDVSNRFGVGPEGLYCKFGRLIELDGYAGAELAGQKFMKG